jgi:hypothetical protein
MIIGHLKTIWRIEESGCLFDRFYRVDRFNLESKN